MSNRSGQSANSNKTKQGNLTSQEQVVAGLVVAGAEVLAANLAKNAIKESAKKAGPDIAQKSGNEEIIQEVAETFAEEAASPELALVSDEVISLALVEDAAYTVTSNRKDDDDDGAWWWLKGLALLGGVALLAGGGGGGGSNPPAAESYDHLSFIDLESGANDLNDVLVMETSRTIANLTLVADENEQTFDDDEDGSLLDETANTQYVFVDQDSNIRTLNLRVSDEDNVRLGLSLEDSLDENGYVLVGAGSTVESVNVLVDGGASLETAGFFEDESGGNFARMDLIYSDVDGRSFTIEVDSEVDEASSLYAEDNAIDNDTADNVSIAVTGSSDPDSDVGSVLESGYSFIYSTGNNLDVTIDLANSTLAAGMGMSSSGSVIESYGDDLTVAIDLVDGSQILASDGSIVYSEGDDAFIAVDATDSFIGSDRLIYSEGNSTSITLDLTRTDVELGDMGIEAWGDDLIVSMTATGDESSGGFFSGGNYLYVEDGSSQESADVIYVNGSNSNINVDFSDYSIAREDASGGYYEAGADDFIRVDAHHQADDELSEINVVSNSSEFSLEDDLIDFNGKKVDISLNISDTYIEVRDSIVDVDSILSEVDIEVTADDFALFAEYGHLFDLKNAASLDLSLTISNGVIGSVVAYSPDNNVNDFWSYGFGADAAVISERLDHHRDVNIINIENGPLSHLDLDLDFLGTAMIADQHFLRIDTLSNSNTNSTVNLDIDSGVATTGDDFINIDKNKMTIDIGLYYESGEGYQGFGITQTGDDFIDLVGDDAVITVDIAASKEDLADNEIQGIGQVHFVADDFVDLSGNRADVTVDLSGNSVIAMSTDDVNNANDFVESSEFINLSGFNQTVNITMTESSQIVTGEDYGAMDYDGSGGGYGGSGSFKLVDIDASWDSSTNATVTISLEDAATIDASTSGGYYISGGYLEGFVYDLIDVNSNNAQINVTLEDDSSISASLDLIELNTNSYNSILYASSTSAVNLNVMDNAEAEAVNGSLIDVYYNKTSYVGEDLEYDNDGDEPSLGVPTETLITLTVDGGDSSGGASVIAGDNLIRIDADTEDNENADSAVELKRDVRLTLNNATAESDGASIWAQDLLGFDVRVAIDESYVGINSDHSYLDNDTIAARGSLFYGENIDRSYVDLHAKDSTIYFDQDNDFLDALVTLDDSDNTDIVINLEDMIVYRDDNGDDAVNIFVGEDSSDLNVSITAYNLRGEDDIDVLSLAGVDDSVFNVTFNDTIQVDEYNDFDHLYFEMGYDTISDASTNNVLNLTLIDTTNNSDLDDISIYTHGEQWNSDYDFFNTIKVNFEEIDLSDSGDDINIHQSFFSNDSVGSGGFTMTTIMDLEGSELDDVYLSFDDKLNFGARSNSLAELYINLNDSEIEDAYLDIYAVDQLNLYTQGTDSSFIHLDIDLAEEVDVVNVYSVGTEDFDFQINFSTTNDYMNDGLSNDISYRNDEREDTTINLALAVSGGARNYDYLDIERFEFAQVNYFETATGRDKIYNNSDFEVRNLEIDSLSLSRGNQGDGENEDSEQWYVADVNIVAGLSESADSNTDTYYFMSDYSSIDNLINMLNSDDWDTDNDGNLEASLGDRLDEENGLGNTYYVMKVSNDLEIYRWISDGIEFEENDYLSHVMTINGAGTSIDSGLDLYGIISTNQFHSVM